MRETYLVRDLMTVGVPTCNYTTPVVKVARFLIENNAEELVVLGEDGEGIGVCGYRELVIAYDLEDVRKLTAEDIMTEGVPELPPDITLKLAAQFMQDKEIRVAYMNHNAAGIIYPAASISYKHLVRHLAAESDEDLKDLGIYAERKSPLEKFIERRDKARRQAGLT